MRKEIIGTLHHISFEKKSLFKGWYAIKDRTGQTYLIEKSFALVSPIKPTIYAVEELSADWLLNDSEVQAIKERQGRQLGWIILVPILGVIIRGLIPMTLFFGPRNHRLDGLTGLYQMGTLLLAIIISLGLLYAFRRYRLKTQWPTVERMGKARVTSPTPGLRMGVSLGVKGWLIYALVFMVAILPMFIFAFLVELRLFMIFPILWVVTLFYRGISIGSDNQVEVVWQDER